MKILVTHHSPDLDALCSVWLFKKFHPEFKDSEVKFVPAGNTYQNDPVDSDKNIVHVDTGRGKFDHHQINQKTCASQIIYHWLKTKKYIKTKYFPALERLVELVIDDDHFRAADYPDPIADYHDLSLPQILSGLKYNYHTSEEIISIGLPLMDACLNNLISKIESEKIIENSYEFNSYWGKTIAIAASNYRVCQLAIKQNYSLVIQKYPNNGYVKISLHPKSTKNLSKIYKLLLKKDKTALWYYHQSGHIILNGTVRHPDFSPSKSSLNQLIAMVKLIK